MTDRLIHIVQNIIKKKKKNPVMFWEPCFWREVGKEWMC